MTAAAEHAEWVRVARTKWAEYQRVLAEDANPVAAGLQERRLAQMVPHLLAAYEALWDDVEVWLKVHRDRHSPDDVFSLEVRAGIDEMLDDFRDHKASGTPLDQPVHTTIQDWENNR